MESYCRFRRSRLRAALLGTSALVASLATISPLHAQQSSWTGGVDGSYLDAGNWSGGTPPPDTAGKGATFASGSNTNISVATPTTVNNWTFSGTTNFALSGAAITFAGGGAGIGSSSAGQISIGNDFSGAVAVQHAGTGSLTLTGVGSTDQVLAGAGTFSVTNGGSLTSSGLALIAQSGSSVPQLVVSGSGSTWNSAGDVMVGLGGNAGVLTIAEGGTVTVASPRTVSIESGSRLNLGTGGTAGTLTVDQINNEGEIVANFTDNSTLAAGIQGGGTLTKSGSGTLTLTGVSGYGTAGTVATFVTGGTLRIENGSALGAGDASFANGTTLDLKGGLGSIENNLLVAGNVNINVASGIAAIGNSPANGAITDDGVTPGGITKTGGGALELFGSNTYTGPTIVAAGTLKAMSSGALPTATDVTVNSGATLVIDDGAFAVQIGSLAGAGSVVIGPNNPVFLDIGGGKQTTFEGSITGNGDLTIINPGTHLTLTGTSNIGGYLTLCNCTDGGLTVSGGDVTVGLGIVVEAGTLTVSNGGKLTQVDSGPGISIDSAMVVTGAGSTVTAAGPTNLGSVTPGSLTIQNGGTFNSNGGVTIGFFGVSGTQVTVTGDGSTWNIDNGLFVNSGASLTVADGGLVNVSGAPPIVASGGTLKIGNGGRAGTFHAASLSLDGQLIANFTDTATLAFNITGDGSVTNDGPGKLTLTGTNQYNGGTFFNAGTISVGSDASLGSSTAALNFNGGLLQVTGTAFTSTARTINWGANGGGFDIADAANIFTLSQDLSGGGPLTKAGPGTLVVTGTNTYSGGTTIREGTLRIDDGGTIGAGDILINGTLAINKSASFTLSNNSSGTGGLNQLGPGTTTLTGTNTYAGATNVVAGTLRAGAVNTFSPNSTHHVAAGATLDLNNFAQVVGALSGAGNVLLGANLTAGGNNASTTFSGQMTGSGAFTKTGAGTLVLSGANSYTGGTTLAQGTLRIEHNQALGSGALITTGSVLDYANGITLANPIAIGSNTTQLNVGSGTATQAGAIAETGGSRPLEKTGAGTLVLAGATSYSGPTSVSAGTLQAGAANVLSPSSAFTVASGATLDLAGHNQTIGSLAGAGAVALGTAVLTAGGDNSSTAFAGIASGTGGLTKAGTGTLILSGTNAYTGTTTVNAGTLSVNGAIAGPVTVNGGATLGGTGTVGSTTVNNGGVLAPGNSIGTITVNGNLVLGAGSIYRVELSPTASDRTNVTGSATLGGTAQLVFGPGTYTQHSYTILSAAGGRSGTFDNVTTEGLPATLTANLSYTATDVLLATLTSQIAPTLAGNTRNQKAVAAAQDTAFNTGLANIAALYDLPLARLPAALDQLSGEVHASTAGVLVDESLYARSAILARLRQASYGGNTGMASLATGGPQTALADEAIDAALAYGKSPIVTKAPLKAPQPSHDIVFWAQGFGAWGRFNGDGNAASVRRDLAGFITGLDTRVGASGRAGIAAGYTGSKNALDGRGSANVETGHVAAYGGWSFGALNLRAGGAYAFHSIDTDRTVAFPGFFDRAFARYDGRTAQVFGEAGYGFAFGNVAIEPFAGGAWVRLDTDPATERGGLAALNVSSNRFEVGYSTLGVRAAGIVPIGDGMVLVPRASAAWQHAFDGVTPEARLAFAASGVPFTIGGVPIARDSLLAEAGLDLAIGRSATLGVSYTGQLARNVSDHAAKGKFSWKFN